MLPPDLSFIYRYFTGEKQESLLFIILGLIALVLAVVCWFAIKGTPSFYKGAAIPLLAIGLIQLVVGYTVYARTDKQNKDIAYNIGLQPVTYTKQTELPRMEKVMKHLVLYRWIEIGFILVGVVLVFLFRSDHAKAFWDGFGIALALQAVIMLSADHFAEKRGKEYVEGLKKMVRE